MIEPLYQEILERKKEPREGSYTNYLFDKGIDKILKKVGEEATEVVIAAKNEDKQELINETADLVYHMLVLLVEQEVSLDEIKEELANREGKLSKTEDRKVIEEL
ncbi:phosphoribosyl-ATP diphosphatase [Enterococcus rivorum]|uniref:Phosphoribosyl-ATP pyrophosphatase n=1 Tax=Enterococcus rivorum TaxID=762845 RepID=A0A1E5KVJ3_9ENTE|nr:phosphoribosyl-ATP diphosphatase [Enterococcus rivorum]MBP2098375.1 phosphoribosyl-ATP pyrophosphohydrolase [Enterococcus rivorum]OEH81838.1 phosphoribosyl-ATP diphosphatase [Enterococcus rivorum]